MFATRKLVNLKPYYKRQMGKCAVMAPKTDKDLYNMMTKAALMALKKNLKVNINHLRRINPSNIQDGSSRTQKTRDQERQKEQKETL